MNSEKFWKTRSENYDKLKWVSESGYIEAFVSSTDFNKEDVVLDVGTGTGVIAHFIAPKVKEVIGLDISQDMLNHSNWNGNKYFIKRDILNPIFYEGVFDKVTARMVFHHITERTQEAMDECYRVLRKGGKMVFSEGIPPSPEVKEDYSRIFEQKEKRITFLEEDLINLMKNSGFKNLETITYIMRGFSVRDWLLNSGLPKEKQELIFQMHTAGSKEFKRVYNLRNANGDCLIDVKNIIMVGER